MITFFNWYEGLVYLITTRPIDAPVAKLKTTFNGINHLQNIKHDFFVNEIIG